MSDIMISFEYKAKKEFPWMSLSKDSEGSYKSRDAAIAFIWYSYGWFAGERG